MYMQRLVNLALQVLRVTTEPCLYAETVVVCASVYLYRPYFFDTITFQFIPLQLKETE